MGGVLVWLLVAAAWRAVDSQSMDQIIQNSMQTSAAADFMQDDGGVMVELDMRFTAQDWSKIQRDMDEDRRGSRKKRKATAYTTHRWTGKVVPYQLYNVFSSSDIAQINAAIADWQRYTCIRFRQRTQSDRNYIYLHSGGGCSSYVGMIGGAQAVSLAPGCRVKGVIIHELGHAIGFQHEQTRPDRDNYVRILTQNIQRGTEFNFQRYSTRVVNNYGVAYDYTSIMHYGQYAFSVNGRPTIQTIDSSKQNLIGNRRGLSFRDIKLANIIYSCAASCGSKTCPGEGYVGSDCNCYCPGSPIKRCDDGDGGDGGDGGEEGECKDEHPNCGTWAAVGECDKNPGWMKVNCKVSCDTCEGEGEGPPPCEDNAQHCVYWKNQGFCTSSVYGPYMSKNCANTCDTCPGSAGTNGVEEEEEEEEEETECINEHEHCEWWAGRGECRKNPNYMLLRCKKACKVC